MSCFQAFQRFHIVSNCQFYPPNIPSIHPVYSTSPISILSTQLSVIFHGRPVSAISLNIKIRETEQFSQTVPTPGNPLFSVLFHYSISPPVTSTRCTPHAIVRLITARWLNHQLCWWSELPPPGSCCVSA